MPEQKRHERVVMRAVKTAKPVKIKNMTILHTMPDGTDLEGVPSGLVMIEQPDVGGVNFQSIDELIESLTNLRRAMRRAGFKTGGRNADR